jgi:hypothetical protein
MSDVIVAQINESWRVLDADGTRWILQHRHEGEWCDRATCCTHDALENYLGNDVHPQRARAVVNAMPAVLPKRPERKRSQVATAVKVSANNAIEADVTVLAQLNTHWRVILDDQAQWWILQRFDGSNWRGRSRFRMRHALERLVVEYAGEVEPAALAIIVALPGHIEWPKHSGQS